MVNLFAWSTVFGAFVTSFYVFGGWEQNLQALSIVTFLYFASTIPMPINNVKNRFPQIYFLLWMIIGALLFTSLPVWVLSVYGTIVSMSGPVYCIVEAVQVVRLSMYLSSWLNEKVQENIYTDSERTWKGYILGITASMFSLAAYLWSLAYTEFLSEWTSNTTMVMIGSATLMILATSISLYAPEGVITDAGSLSVLVAYSVWRASKGDQLITGWLTVGTLFYLLVGILILLSVALMSPEIFIYDEDEEESEKNTSTDDTDGIIDQESLLKAVLVVLFSYVFGRISGTFQSHALILSSLESILAVIIYGVVSLHPDYEY
eukprot:14793_1